MGTAKAGSYGGKPVGLDRDVGTALDEFDGSLVVGVEAIPFILADLRMLQYSA